MEMYTLESLSQVGPSAPQRSRLFLDRVPPPQRGLVGNLFLAPVRAGLTDSAAIVRAVREELLCKAAYAQRWQQHDSHAKMLALLQILKQYPGEASALAQWAMTWDATPLSEREQMTSQRRETHRRQWQAEQPPTEKQVAYLRRLGHHGAVTNRLEASDLISQLLQGGRCHAG